MNVLRVLLIEDSASDADLMIRQLKKAGYTVEAERVETAEQLQAALTSREWDIVLADYQLPQFDAPTALTLVQATHLDVPFIVISGTIGEEAAVAMMRAGAHDYLMKDHLARLAPAVQRELADALVRRERRQAEEALRRSEYQYRQLIDQAADGIFVADPQGNYIEVNRAGCEMLGYTREEILQLNMRQLIMPQELARQLLRLTDLGAGRTTTVCHLIRKDGSWLPVEISGKQLDDGRLQGIVRDISDRLRAEAALRESEARYRAIFNGVRDAIFVETLDGQILDVNEAACQMHGYSHADFCRLHVADIVPPGHLVVFPHANAALGGLMGPIETFNRRANGDVFPVEINGQLQTINGEKVLLVVARDITERKYAEEALRQSERTLQSTLDGLSAHIANLDEHGNIIVINAAWKQFAALNGLTMNGYGLGQNYLEICDTATGDCSEEASAMAAGIRAVLAGQRDYFYLEYPCHGPDVQRWFAARVTRFHGEGPARVVVAHDNITVRVLAEQELRRYAQRLENLHNIDRAILQAQSPYAIAEALLQQISQLISNQWSTIVLYGEATNEAVVIAQQGSRGPQLENGQRLAWSSIYESGQTELEHGRPVIIHDLAATTPLSPLLKMLAEAGLRRMIHMPLLAHGWLVGVLNLASIEAGAYTPEQIDIVQEAADQLALAIHQARLHEQVQQHASELEERVQARTRELARERERLRAILDSIGEGVVFTNRNGAIEYINPAMERLTGYAADEALGQNPRIWQSGQTPLTLYEQMWDTILRGEVWQGELINRCKSGRLYDAALTVAPLTDEALEIVGFVGAQRDITRQKELDRLKDQFVSNVSHELRTPLTSIMLNLELLDHGKLEKRDAYLQTVHRETQRLKIMIEDLLDLSRLDRQAVPIKLTVTDLHQLLQQLVIDRAAVAAERNLTLEFLPTAESSAVLADVSMLTQVISNLMTNALNYTPPGGSIIVQTHLQRAAAQDWLTLTVRDTGPGISAHELPRLFERFYRGEVGRKAKAPGTGLGLAISKEIIERLGGRITVESEPGFGAAFTVWLRPG